MLTVHSGNSSLRVEEAEEARVPSQRGLHSPTLTQNKTRRERDRGSRELLLGEDTSSKQVPGGKDSRLPRLGLEHGMGEAELVPKAIKATLRKGQGDPGVLARARARGGRNPTGSEKPSHARPLARGRHSGPTSPGVTSPFYLPGMRGAWRKLAVRPPPCRGARPRRTRRECSNAPRYNLPAGTNFRLLTDGPPGSGSPAYRLDATDATPSDSRFKRFFGRKGFPFRRMTVEEAHGRCRPYSWERS